MFRRQGCVVRRLILRNPRLPAAGAIVSRKQPIPLDQRSTKCIPSRAASRRIQDAPNPEPPSVTENSIPTRSSTSDISSSDKLAALCAFFDLLSQWDESVKGEIEHE